MGRRLRSRRSHRGRHAPQARRPCHRRPDDDLRRPFSLPWRRRVRQGRQCLHVHASRPILITYGELIMKTLQSIVTGVMLVVGLGLAPVLPPAPALAVDSMSSTGAPDLTSVRTKINAKDYAAAVAELRDLAEDSQQPDVYNLLGFTLRKTGDFTTSLTYYTKALELQPDHKAAREYLGELYVETGNIGPGVKRCPTMHPLRTCKGMAPRSSAVAGSG